MQPTRRFFYFLTIAVAFLNLGALADSENPIEFAGEVHNFFEPFIGDYKILKVLKSVRNGGAYENKMYKFKVGYETSEEKKTDKVLTLQYWVKEPDGGVYSAPLINSHAKKGDWETNSEVVQLSDGARLEEKSKDTYQKTSRQMELRRGKEGQIIYRYRYEYHHWRYGDDHVEVELLLEKSHNRKSE